MKIKYIEKNFQKASLEIIDKANEIIEEYSEKYDLDLTGRQLYYQFIAQDAFPDSWFDKKAGSKNSERSYKRLGALINDARLAGLVSWTAIRDLTRTPGIWRTETCLDNIFRLVPYNYSIDRWKNQENRVEVWVEKDALSEIIEKAARPYKCTTFSCRGYVSQSAMWQAAQRFQRYNKEGQQVIILHAGDHDPSGIDMSRDIKDRLTMFEVEDFELKRIALNMNQIRKYNPPASPTKIQDSRAADYINKFGEDCWELDALNPGQLIKLVETEIEKFLDKSAYNEQLKMEETIRQKIRDEMTDVTEKFESDPELAEYFDN